MAVPMLHAEAGSPPQRIGLAHPSLAPYGVFETNDGAQILISIQNDREWLAFSRDVLKQPGLSLDERFATTVARLANRPQTDAIVAACFASNTAAGMITLLNAADVAYGRVSDLDTLLAHPNLRRVSIATPGGDVLLPAPPAQVQGENQSFGPTPALGGNDAAVRAEFLT
jgi:itaconate CoA-transferase